MHIEEIKLIKTTKRDKKYSWFDIESNIEKEYSQKNLNNVLDALKDKFKENNITYIWGNFSGGHDEGGFDDAEFYDENLKKVEPKDLTTSWVTQYSLFKTEENEEIKYYVSEYSKTIDMLKPDSNYNAIALLYKTGALNEYGSFAGEFHVDGEVKLNVITKKYHVTGSQTVEQWEDIEQEGSLA
jgi:hypothetical protein